MKKYVALLLSVILLLTVTGCRHDDNEVLNESGQKIVTLLSEKMFEPYIDALREDMADELTDIELVVEYLPDDAIERETALSRVRAEIVSGGGPDVFLVSTGNQSQYRFDSSYSIQEQFAVMDSERLFPDAKKTMHNNVFLPLNEYLDEEYLKFGDHVETIIEAGSLDGTQYILPFAYEYRLFFFEKLKVDNEQMQFGSWNDLRDCNDNYVNKTLQLSDLWTAAVFPDIADYENNSVKITEEEFKSRLVEISEYLQKDTGDVELDIVGDVYSGIDADSLVEWNKSFDEMIPLAIPNTDGGLTVYINSFIAVNANCNNTQASVKVAEMFFSEDAPKLENLGMSYLGLRTFKSPYYDLKGSAVEEYLLHFSELFNTVSYSPNIDDVIAGAVWELRYGEDPDIDKVVNNAYTEIQMIMAE